MNRLLHHVPHGVIGRAAIVVVACVASFSVASSVLIHPFQSDDDGRLGMVVADRVAESLDGLVSVIVGPAAAPSAVPPFRFGDGFVSPLGTFEGGDAFSLHGAQILRAGTGVDVAVTGTVRGTGEGLRLTVYTAFADGSTSVATVEAGEDDPAALSRWLALALSSRLGVDVPPSPRAIDLSGEDDALARMLTLMAAGFVDEAVAIAEERDAAAPISSRLEQHLRTLRAVRAGDTATEDPVLAAMLALSGSSGGDALDAFMQVAAEAGWLAAEAWRGAIAADSGSIDRADVAYTAAAAYEYGAATGVAHARVEGREGTDAPLAAAARGTDPAAAIVATLWASQEADIDLERAALDALTRSVPTFAWPFERRSFVAFDDEDGLAAAQALIVATRRDPLDPVSWTNLGWAWYLLGSWERSERASIRALDIDPGGVIAAYNLGLVRARFGRLDEAMPVYERALAADPEVDDEAILDVENALLARPGEASLYYALGRLYETEGRRDEAAAAYQSFLSLGGFGRPYDGDAARRVQALLAPPPPLEIAGDVVDVVLAGVDHPSPWGPGDRIGFVFEVYTPGDALPSRLSAAIRLMPSGSGDVVATADVAIEVPQNAIGYVVDPVTLDLPFDLPAGGYVAVITLSSPGVADVSTSVDVEVGGDVQPLRRLASRSVRFLALSSGRPLFDVDDVDRPNAVANVLVEELRRAASAAEEALPTVESGRFAGMGGGELFESSTADDLLDFLAALAQRGPEDVDLTFVDAYAQWALDGAPER